MMLVTYTGAQQATRPVRMFLWGTPGSLCVAHTAAL